MKFVQVWTDGAVKTIDKVRHGSAAAILCVKENRKKRPYRIIELGTWLGVATNQVAELHGVKLGLEEVIASPWITSRIQVFTDSKYCRGLFRKVELPAWASNGDAQWEFTARANRELVLSIRKLVLTIPHFEIFWIKGHAGYYWNERADAIAQKCKVERKDWRHAYSPDRSKRRRRSGSVVDSGDQSRSVGRITKSSG